MDYSAYHRAGCERLLDTMTERRGRPCPSLDHHAGPVVKATLDPWTSDDWKPVWPPKYYLRTMGGRWTEVSAFDAEPVWAAGAFADTLRRLVAPCPVHGGGA